MQRGVTAGEDAHGKRQLFAISAKPTSSVLLNSEVLQHFFSLQNIIEGLGHQTESKCLHRSFLAFPIMNEDKNKKIK